MTGSDISSAGLDPRRRRLLFRAWRRGMRELDLAFGQFADAQLAGMGEAELAEFERLLDVPDTQMLAWIMGDAPAVGFDAGLVARIVGAACGRVTKSGAS